MIVRHPQKHNGPYRVTIAPHIAPAGRFGVVTRQAFAIRCPDGTEYPNKFKRGSADRVCALLNDAYHAGRRDGQAGNPADLMRGRPRHRLTA